jgi:hypothetical protein
MGAKKKKKTKAELEAERLQREEEERLAAEAELKRQAEEEERRRLEDLRIKAERKKYREEEIERLTVEYHAMLDDQEDRAKRMEDEIAHENEKKGWKKYRNPTNEPDAHREADINTFITLASEENRQDLPEALEHVTNILGVSQLVEGVLSETLSKRSAYMFKRSCEYASRFFDMVVEKVDYATAQMLRYSDAHPSVSNGDKNEFFVEELADGIGIGLWASFAEIRLSRKVVKFEKVGVDYEIPKPILTTSLDKNRYVHRIMRISMDKFSYMAFDFEKPALSSHSFVNDGETQQVISKFVVGDLLVFDLLECPPPAHMLRAKKWTFRDASTSSLNICRCDFPTTVAGRCHFKVPPEVIMGDDLRVAIWDESTKNWTDNGISDFQYNVTNRQVNFLLAAVGIVALVRERTVEMPYKKWLLSPICPPEQPRPLTKPYTEPTTAMEALNLNDPEGGGKIITTSSSVIEEPPSLYEKMGRFELHTKSHVVVIIIEGTVCYLEEPKIPEFHDLIGVTMPPGTLLYKLQRRGLNLLATDNDLVSMESYLLHKRRDLEENVLRNISRCASTCDFMSCPWNQQLHNFADAAIFVRESTVYTGGMDTFDYECVRVIADDQSESHLHAPDVGEFPVEKLRELRKDGKHLLKPEEITEETEASAEGKEGVENAGNEEAKLPTDAVESPDVPAEEAKEEFIEKEVARNADGHRLITPRVAPHPDSLQVEKECVAQYNLVVGNEYGKRRQFNDAPRTGEIAHLELKTALASRLSEEARERIQNANERFAETVFLLLRTVRPFSLA